MNNQTNIGSANIISGVPERVGAPVDAFKEVGAVLTQRYWQNKQQMDGITIALKNAPIIKWRPMLSVIVAKIKTKTKKMANRDSLPFKKSKIVLSLSSIKFSFREKRSINL